MARVSLDMVPAASGAQTVIDRPAAPRDPVEALTVRFPNGFGAMVFAPAWLIQVSQQDLFMIDFFHGPAGAEVLCERFVRDLRFVGFDVEGIRQGLAAIAALKPQTNCSHNFHSQIGQTLRARMTWPKPFSYGW
jgi:hypothetical protein